jgi:chemotaxis protein MotA
MFALIGIVVVFGAIMGGFLMEKGPVAVLMQPSEMVIIGGAAMGTLLIANPLPLVIRIFKSILGVIAGSKYDKAFYMDGLKMLSDIFSFARKSGMAKLEEDVENPDKSAVFPSTRKSSKITTCCTLSATRCAPPWRGWWRRMILDDMIEKDIDIHHAESLAPAKAFAVVSDALPGLGIVAAVLGVVITMGALGGPPEEIGKKVAAALVGTFLGILLSYGVVSPIAANLEKTVDAELQFYQMLRTGLMAFAKGMAPMIAVEFSRRAVPHDMRPGFKEMEAACKGGAAGAPAAAKAA